MKENKDRCASLGIRELPVELFVRPTAQDNQPFYDEIHGLCLPRRSTRRGVRLMDAQHARTRVSRHHYKPPKRYLGS